MNYKFSVWEFTSKQIDQVVQIIKHSQTGNPNDLFPSYYCLDMRKINRHSPVFQWAKSRGLLRQGKDIIKDQKKKPYYVKAKGPNRWYLSPYNNFSLLYDTPIEAIFRLVRPIIEKSKGGQYTIISNPLWRDLGIWEKGSRYWDKIDQYQKEYQNHIVTYGQNRYFPFMLNIMCLLNKHNYIIFQFAGSIWSISKTYDKAYPHN